MVEDIRVLNELVEKSGLPLEKIFELISKKIDELGGMVTEKTAIYLVSKELGVKLESLKDWHEREEELAVPPAAPETIYNPFTDKYVDGTKLLDFLNGIYKVSQIFIKNNFPPLNATELRITTLAIMKLITKILKGADSHVV